MDAVTMHSATDLMQRIMALAPVVAQHRAEFEALRRMPKPVVEAMVAADLFRLWTPRRFGGAEVSPRDFVDLIEAASAMDGSFGWCLTNANTMGRMVAYLPESAARNWVSQPDCQMAGSTASLGQARRAEGGFVVSGRWPFASGISSARRIIGLCKVEGEGDPQHPVLILCHFDAGAVKILDTWQVSGLKGTGSHDFIATDVFVSDDHAHGLVDAVPSHSGALYRFPIVSMLTFSVAIVPLGIAKSAIQAFMDLADRTRAGTTQPLKDRETIQADLARAEAMRRSGRALMLSALDDLEQALAIGGQPLIEARAFFRVALAHSAECCVRAVELVTTAAGAAAIMDSSPLERCSRDIQAAVKHIAMAPHNFALGGKIMLGVDTGSARF